MESSRKAGSAGLEDFSRLQQEHEKALRATQETIRKWEQFKYDYDVLQARLHTLPDSLTHDVMVPFGRFGFMQGHLYHTNEVMVLLGDNWFAQRTAKQAIEIAERRKKCEERLEGVSEMVEKATRCMALCCVYPDVCEMLDKERKQLEDWEARSSFVQELSATAEAHKDGFEIREEYDPKEEEKRKQAKREERERRRGGVKVPPPRPAFPKKTSAGVGNVRRGGGEGEGSVRRGGGEGERRMGDKEEEKLWKKLEQQERDEEERLVGGCESGEGGEGGEGGRRVQKSTPTITFKHSQTTPCRATKEVEGGGGGGGEGERMVYSSPADISRPRGRNDTPSGGTTVEERRVEEEEKEEGEEVVRGVRWDPHLVSYSQLRDEDHTTQPSHTTTPPRSRPAFSGVVREKPDPTSPSQQSSTRKVSKFKSSRSTKHST